MTDPTLADLRERLLMGLDPECGGYNDIFTEGVDAVLALLEPAGWHMNKATWENELLYRITDKENNQP